MKLLWYLFLASTLGACWWYILICFAVRHKAGWVGNAYWILLVATDKSIMVFCPGLIAMSVTDLKLVWWFTVEMGSVADVSAVSAAFMFTV
jgi:hypothetical protein